MNKSWWRAYVWHNGHKMQINTGEDICELIIQPTYTWCLSLGYVIICVKDTE